jgi:3-deoxy-D-manno-octulosonate 8-phosphate phosphatase (KDO 8-P phosphatase)
MVIRGTADDVRERASRIRMLLTDVDGVLTDAGVYYSSKGEELKRFSMRDGMGFERLLSLAGIRVGIITRENSTIVAARAAKLNVGALYTGVADKLERAEQIARQQGMPLSRIAFIGDDVNDLQLLRAVGLSACPSDADSSVLGAVDLVCTRAGGHGAFREFAEFLIDAHVNVPATRGRTLAAAGATLVTPREV